MSEVLSYIQKTDFSLIMGADVKKCYDSIQLVY